MIKENYKIRKIFQDLFKNEMAIFWSKNCSLAEEKRY
jgi:hypothetical protein